jgi:phosphomannomutase
MERIHFGTDGWREIVASQFTVANVAKATSATATWLMRKYSNPEVVIGYDTRFLGRMFAETAAKVLAAKSIRVRMAEDFVTTPMVSLAVKELGASLGIMITGSHNDFRYNGFKLKGSYGGSLLADDLKDIEHLISLENEFDLELLKWDVFIELELIRYINLEELYFNYIKDHFDLKQINGAGLKIAFDAMYGSGQRVIKKIIKKARFFHCTVDPIFDHTPPEPLERNLQEMGEFLRESGDFDIGLAIDGDGDRIALLNRDGQYIDSHRIILILIHYLAKYRNLNGKVITGFSSTSKVEKLSLNYGLMITRVPIGFKDICKIMLTDEVLVGGEESGGIAVKGYLPERDGIWMALIILQFMAETGKSLDDILQEIYQVTGPFACSRRDIQIPKEKRSRIMEKCRTGDYRSFGRFEVESVEELGGTKFYFNENEWVLLRTSGTEPLLRIYSEAMERETAEEILEAAYKTVMYGD